MNIDVDFYFNTVFQVCVKIISVICLLITSHNTQKAECFLFINFFLGINVCLPSPAACLKEVAKQISDRDNAVRNAALNCVVQAYYIVGEKVYKMVGQVIILHFLSRCNVYFIINC